MVPLQSSSAPLQISLAAGWMEQLPHMPSEQVWIPLAQTPTAPASAQLRVLPFAHSQTADWLGTPSQSSSTRSASQISVAPGLTVLSVSSQSAEVPGGTLVVFTGQPPTNSRPAEGHMVIGSAPSPA